MLPYHWRLKALVARVRGDCAAFAKVKVVKEDLGEQVVVEGLEPVVCACLKAPTAWVE
jgi:hypothetical protein